MNVLKLKRAIILHTIIKMQWDECTNGTTKIPFLLPIYHVIVLGWKCGCWGSECGGLLCMYMCIAM